MKLSRRWKIAAAVTVLIAVATLLLALAFHFQPEQEVEAYKRQLIARGEKLEFKDILPPRVDPTNNGAGLLREAFKGLNPDYHSPYVMRPVRPGIAMVSSQQPDLRGYDFTNSWEEVAADVAANRTAIDLVYQAATRPRLEFRSGDDLNVDHALTNLSGFRHAIVEMEFASVSRLHDGDIDAAITHINTILELAQKNEGDGLLISHLVRMAIVGIAIAPTWESLQNTNPTDTQLASMQKKWEQLDFLEDEKTAVVRERAWAINFIEKARASHESFHTNFSFYLRALSPGAGSPPGGRWTWPPDWEEITEKPRYVVGEAMWRGSWSYAQELHALKVQQIVLDTLRTMQTNHSQFYKADYDAMRTRTDALGLTNAASGIFETLKIPDFKELADESRLTGVVYKMLRMETARRLTVTAIAIKRFQLRHGRYPINLEELVPEFLSAVPIDPMIDKPLSYRPDPQETFLLYSVGQDGHDDGGDPACPPGIRSASFYWQNDHARDWVWPRPATTEEIEAFYTKPPD